MKATTFAHLLCPDIVCSDCLCKFLVAGMVVLINLMHCFVGQICYIREFFFFCQEQMLYPVTFNVLLFLWKIFFLSYFSQVGLISDEKLVDLLDLALSADTVNTVKNLREILEMGVEPLALMSQLATVVTDILAGTYDFTKERNRRKFFQRLPCKFRLFLFPLERSYFAFSYV